MKRFSNILFVSSSAMDDTAALKRAVALARNNQAKLTVVGIVGEVDNALTQESTDKSVSHLKGMIVESRHNELQQLINLEAASQTPIEFKVLVGKAFVEVIREVLRFDRDLVIKSAEPIDGLTHLFGSTDMKLLRKCPCPLWIVNSTQQHKYREILAAVDYDPDNSAADELNGQILEMATSIAIADFAQLHIVHVWQLQHESYLRSPRLNNTNAEVDALVEVEKAKRRKWLKSLVDKHCTAQDSNAVDYLKPNIHLPKGNAHYEISKLASDISAELVVMGTIGRSGIPGIIIGNTAETILRQITCSVLAVKPAGFVSPITL